MDNSKMCVIAKEKMMTTSVKKTKFVKEKWPHMTNLSKAIEVKPDN